MRCRSLAASPSSLITPTNVYSRDKRQERSIASRFISRPDFFFLECGAAGRNDPTGGDGTRGLALSGTEDTDGRVRRGRASKTRPRFRDLQRGRQEAGLSKYQRA